MCTVKLFVAIKIYNFFSVSLFKSVNHAFIFMLLLIPHNNLSGHMFDPQMAMPGDTHNKRIT